MVGTLYDTDGTTILEENHFNSWNSRLWARVRSTFSVELNQMYTTLRSNGLFTLENMLSYFERVWEVIPPKMYNESQQIKYINDGAVGTVALHGNRKLQIKKWLRERIAYLDSKFGYYAGGGTNEQYVNFRMNYQGAVSLDLSTYYTVYAKVRWASKNEQIIRIAKGQKKTFSYYSDVGTDREVMIMLPEALKTIENISNIHPNSIDISKATKLTQIEAHNPNLFSVDLSKNKYLRKVDFNGCTNLGTETATMTLNYCKYLNKVDLRGTQITAVTFNNKGGSLREIYYPTSIQSINLVNQSLLTSMVLPYGEDGSKAPTDLATINIENCPNISKLIDLVSDPASLSGMKYCRNLTLNNSIKLNRFNFYGFTRLANVNLENMESLEEVDFLNMTEVGQTSNLRYIGVSACPNMTTISMNVDNPNYEITWASDSILDLQTAGGVRNIYSNCVIKGLNTILLPITIENMYFTSEYGSGYSDIVNIWSPSCATISKSGVYPIAYHLNENNEADDYIGIDFKDLNLHNIDLGALVKIPSAINFNLCPTNANPNFNKNRDGVKLPYLQPTGTLDLSNYTESLARFFNGVDLNKLQLIVTKTLPQTDLSYCFYNSTFDNEDRIAPILDNLISISNMDYCFYKTSISDISILNRVNFASGTSMKYCFAYCPNITELADITLSNKIGDSSYMFSGSGLITVRNVTTSSGNITGLFSRCNSLRTVENFVADGTDSYESLFEGCAMSLPPITSIPENIVNVKNMYKDCPNLTSINGFVFHENLIEVDGFVANCGKLVNANNITIASSCYNNLFRGLVSLKYVNNLLITYVGRNMSFDNMFDGCTSLIEFSLHNDSYVKEVITMDYMFRGTNISNIDLTNVNFDKLSSAKYLFADSHMSSITFKLPPSVKYIQNILSNCTNLREIKDTTFGNQLMSATDWIQGSPLRKVTNCIIDTDVMSFANVTTLSEVNNLTWKRRNIGGKFYGCTGLKRISINIENTVVSAYKESENKGTFENCTSLVEIDFLQSDFSRLERFDRMFYGDINLTSITNFKITNANTICGREVLVGCPISSTDGLYINSQASLEMFKMGVESKIINLTDFEVTENVKDFSHLFENSPSLVEDKAVPPHATSVEKMYYNCPSLESITSNWVVIYDNDDMITADCYAGCENIKYIDGELYMNELNEYTAIYNIPQEWGGSLSFDSFLNGFEISSELLTDATISFEGIVGDCITNWGDGAINRDTTHTYSREGRFIIRTEIPNPLGLGTGSPASADKTHCITKIFKLHTSILTNGNYLLAGFDSLYRIYDLTFDNTANGSHMLDGCTKLAVFNAENWNIGGTDLSYMFNNCPSITHVSINIPDNIKNISYMFNGCTGLKDISGSRFGAGITTTTDWIPKSQILYANNISLNSQKINFKNFNKLTQCNNLMINPSFTNLNELFYGCSSIMNIDLSNNSLLNCRGVARLCESCTSLLSLKLPEFSDKVELYRMCAGCSKVEVIEFYPKIMDVSRQYGFADVNYQVFSNCSNLTTLKNFKVKCTLLDSDREKYLLRQKLDGVQYMWSGTNNLKNTEGMGIYNNDGRVIFYGYRGNISEFEIGSEVTDVSYLFANSSGITKLDLSSWDAGSVTNLTYLVQNCSKLTSFIPPTNISVSLSDFTKATSIAVGDLVSIINNLSTVSSTQTLTLGSTNLAKLTPQQVKIATDKGWTVV